jgi:hypothetical protein
MSGRFILHVVGGFRAVGFLKRKRSGFVYSMGLRTDPIKNIEELDDALVFLLEKVQFLLQLQNKIALVLQTSVADCKLLLELVFGLSELVAHIFNFLIIKGANARKLLIDSLELLFRITQTLSQVVDLLFKISAVLLVQGSFFHQLLLEVGAFWAGGILIELIWVLI